MCIHSKILLVYQYRGSQDSCFLSLWRTMMCVFYLVLHQLPSWGELHSFSGIPQMSVQAEQGLGGTTADDALLEHKNSVWYRESRVIIFLDRILIISCAFSILENNFRIYVLVSFQERVVLKQLQLIMKNLQGSLHHFTVFCKDAFVRGRE